MNKLDSKLHQQLMEIGREGASLWGGECCNCSIDLDEKEVVFDCIEHGEDFCFVLTFEELQKQYKVNLDSVFQNKTKIKDSIHPDKSNSAQTKSQNLEK